MQVCPRLPSVYDTLTVNVFVFFGRHNSELQKVKDVQAAAEKIRREKWIDEKTKKIKVKKVTKKASLEVAMVLKKEPAVFG